MPKRLVRPDLVVDREEGLHLLGQRRRVLDLALANMAARARAAVMIDAAGALPTWSTIADILPTRRLTTAHHVRAQPSIGTAQKPGLCGTIAHGSSCTVTDATCFLNLVSLVRFQPGAPLLACKQALSHVCRAAVCCRIGQVAEMLPVSFTRRPAAAPTPRRPEAAP